MQPDRVKLKSQIVEFIDKYVGDDDTVVGVLRYGSHIPHVYQNACLETGKQPRSISLVLSHMLRFFSREFYRDSRFLVLDDTIYEGVIMREMLSELEELNVDRDRIRTAALIAHEQSDFPLDCPKAVQKLRDAEYVAWKEELASLVRQDIRPTERDHPLYYFDGDKISLGRFLSVIEDYGRLHPVGSDWTAPAFRASLTIDSSVLGDVDRLDGIELDGIAKIRFYWNAFDGGWRITAAPIVFAVVDIPTFVPRSGALLARMLGLPEAFFDSIYESRRYGMVFYFVTRCVAALLLQRFFSQAGPRIQGLGCDLRLVPPEVVDGSVKYLFPNEYIEFYSTVMANLKELLAGAPDISMLPFGDRWILPRSARTEPLTNRHLLPEIYRLLEFLARDSEPAKWNGKRWLPSKDLKGVSFRELVGEFKDVCFVSAALDELLDSGLIRAKDACDSTSNNRPYFLREFLSGGEYKALQVSRIAETWRFQTPAFDPTLAEAEAVELWGTY